VKFIALILLLSTSSALAADPPSDAVKSSIVSLSYAESCDDRQNRRIKIANNHLYRTARVTVKWRAAGGKELQEEFLVPPGDTKQVGCGVEGSIVNVILADF
jgi:hypothetical protein